MAAPKAGGMRFRGDLQGEPKPVGRLPEGLLDLSGMDWSGRRGRIPPGAGRGQFSLAVPERTGRGKRRPIAQQAGDRPRQCDRAGRYVHRAEIILHNGSIMNSEAWWSLYEALTCRQ
jgi:hypothetical protein